MISGMYPASHQAGWFGLVLFYSISTIVGYLMPNPFHTHGVVVIVVENGHDNMNSNPGRD